MIVLVVMVLVVVTAVVVVFTVVSASRGGEDSENSGIYLEIDKKSCVLIMGAFLCHFFADVYNMHVVRMSDFSYISIVFLYS